MIVGVECVTSDSATAIEINVTLIEMLSGEKFCENFAFVQAATTFRFSLYNE